MSKRDRAFDEPNLASWWPSTGETVYIKHGLTATGKVLWFTWGIVCVELVYGRKKFKRQYALDDVRPLPAKRKK